MSWNNVLDMLYRQEKPCFQGKQTRFDPSLATPYCISNGLPLYGLRVQFKCSHGFPYQTWNFPIPSHTFRCFMLSAQNMFMSIHYMTWPWDTRSSDRSIISELFSLSFRAAKQNSRRKKIKLYDDADQPLQERRSWWACEDRWEPLWPFPLFLPRNLGVEILVRWVEL
jgi:hypothetical protein